MEDPIDKDMAKKWLLCDFHIHTKFSDGAMELKDVVDLFGSGKFDCIAITDHLVDSRSVLSWLARKTGRSLNKKNFYGYMEAVEKAALYAGKKYGMIVMPGFEISNNSRFFHMLALDVKEYIDPDLMPEECVRQIHARNGIAVACHPHHFSSRLELKTLYLWENRDKYEKLFDAWEVANRDDLFNVIGLKKYNYIANSDFHKERHFYSWKTLLKAEKSIDSIKDAIKINKDIALKLLRPGM